MKKKAMISLALLSGTTMAGYYYMKKNPKVINDMKRMTKGAAKKVYNLLDDIDE